MPGRSATSPCCHLAVWVPKIVWYSAPMALGGVVEDVGYSKMSRNVWNCGVTSRSGEAIASWLVGACYRPLDSWAGAAVSVVRYLISAEAAAGFFEPLPM